MAQPSLELFYAFIEFRKRPRQNGQNSELPDNLTDSLRERILHYSALIDCPPRAFYDALLDLAFVFERLSDDDFRSLMEE